MKKNKQFDVVFDDGSKKTVVIQELSVRQIEGLVSSMDLQAFQVEGASLTEELKKLFRDKLIPIVTNLTLDEVFKMYPSDIEQVIFDIQEVNKSFFTVLAKLDIVTWAKQLLQVLGQHLLAKIVSGAPAANS